MKEFVELRAKFYSYLIDDSSEDKKAKGTKKVSHKKLKKLIRLLLVLKFK